MDGSFNMNDGRAGLGGALSYEHGELIMTFSIAGQCSSHNIAEAKATWFGSKWCKQNGYTNIIMELDSLLIINMLKKNKASSSG
ncbi:hypothetical protein MTR67_019844 [Solanum verrucosum]|uniref:RNase H type-1 domain-containing protein n=1 Tax=Solanum verrucosum TaxID=315347 RepID=A0AAF0QM77_SOLVR|nr:hypothetical protein MTR67_019844 [Solanum verrucosum]